jgi:hypothetical protein
MTVSSISLAQLVSSTKVSYGSLLRIQPKPGTTGDGGTADNAK